MTASCRISIHLKITPPLNPSEHGYPYPLPVFRYYAIFISMILRSFIAIEIPASLQDVIAQQTANLRQQFQYPAIRWVPKRNIHLTIKFLGEVSTQILEVLARSLNQEVNKMKSFSITAGEMGIFPSGQKPRIIWVGIKAPPVLFTLQSKIEAISSSLGHKIENRPFSPHITIGRFGNAFPKEKIPIILRCLESMNFSIHASVEINSITIFKSDLNPSGSVYTPILAIPFEKQSIPR